MIRFLSVVLLVLTFTPALAQQRPAATPPPQPQPVDAVQPAGNTPLAADPAMALRRSRGSLIRASIASDTDPAKASIAEVGLFAVPAPQPRKLRKHDLVTIIIREQSDLSSKGTTDVQRDASVNASIDDFVKLDIDNFEIQGGAIGAVAPSVQATGTREFQGEGTISRSDSFTARITAEVLDVKPNGTLVLQARKTIKADEEEQQFTLTGICRAEDVLLDNTVLSTQIHDLSLSKSHKGAVRDANKRGLINRVLDAVNLF